MKQDIERIAINALHQLTTLNRILVDKDEDLMKELESENEALEQENIELETQLKNLKEKNQELEQENKLFRDNLYKDIKIYNDLPV